MLLNLARFPEVQEKCYEELKARNFESDDFGDCPYLNSTVWESARYSSGVYRSLIHRRRFLEGTKLLLKLC